MMTTIAGRGRLLDAPGRVARPGPARPAQILAFAPAGPPKCEGRRFQIADGRRPCHRRYKISVQWLWKILKHRHSHQYDDETDSKATDSKATDSKAANRLVDDRNAGQVRGDHAD